MRWEDYIGRMDDEFALTRALEGNTAGRRKWKTTPGGWMIWWMIRGGWESEDEERQPKIDGSGMLE